MPLLESVVFIVDGSGDHDKAAEPYLVYIAGEMSRCWSRKMIQFGRRITPLPGVVERAAEEPGVRINLQGLGESGRHYYSTNGSL